jgi:hypothetical protein
MDQPGLPATQTFNPWSVVNLVFHHLAEQGLHPVLGESGEPGRPAPNLLLGIRPTRPPQPPICCGRWGSNRLPRATSRPHVLFRTISLSFGTRSSMSADTPDRAPA